MNIIQAISDPKLFRRFLADKNGSLKTWQAWNVFLRCLYGRQLKEKHRELVLKATGRSIESLQGKSFNDCLCLVGRRGGKSRIASIVATYEATLSNKEESVGIGETPLVATISPTRKQGRIIRNYCRGVFEHTPMLADEVVRENKDGFELSNKVLIEILVGCFRAVRGYTLLCAIVEECCFFHQSEESKVRNAQELITAIRPSLSTVNGLLLCISTKYAKKGYAYRTWKRHWGKENSDILVWDADTITMHPNFPQSIIDKSLAEDLSAARSEWLNFWREDIQQFLPRQVVELAVVKGRLGLLPRLNCKTYSAFVDLSGARIDPAAICIGFRNDRKKVIVSFLKQYKAPYQPYEVVASMCAELKKFGLRKVTGDNYGGEWIASAFRSNGISYTKSPLPKSALYLELIPAICGDGIELLDDEKSVDELCNLERKTRSGGKDIVDHPASSGNHDDLANCIAGLSYTSRHRRKVGAFFSSEPKEPSYESDLGYNEISKVQILAG